MKKILIIDDDPDFIDACRNMLEAVDYEVDCANRADQALAKIDSFRPELVLLDILMDNKLAGFEIAETLAKGENYRGIAVIFLTGYFMRTGLRELQNEVLHKWRNVKSVLDKPVKPAKLLETIRKI